MKVNKYEKAFKELMDELSKIGMFHCANERMILQELVERATSKKPIYVNKNLDDLSPLTTSQCPICGVSIYSEPKYCHNCGKALDFS
jgi:hypothetical protein